MSLADELSQDKKPLANPALGSKVDTIIGSLDINKCQRGPSVYSSNLSISVSPTMFGWTVVAPVDHEESKPICKVQAHDNHLHQSLQQLWELDKTPESPSLSANDEKAYFTSMIPTKLNLMADTRSNFVNLTILRPLDNLDTQQFDVSSRMRSPLLGRTSSKPLTKYSMSMSNSTMQNLYLVEIWTSPHHIFIIFRFMVFSRIYVISLWCSGEWCIISQYIMSLHFDIDIS